MIFPILIILLIVLALFGMPLFAVIASVAMMGFYYSGIDLMIIPMEIYRISDAPVLMALPLFTFAGYMLSESKTSHRLVRLTRAFLGWMPGGIAMVAYTACSLFTAFTGGSGVTIVALGALIFPALLQAGYSERFSLGLSISSGSLGLLLPPSLPLILYGIISQQMKMSNVPSVSLDDLFLAGICPALLILSLLFVFTLWMNRDKPVVLTKFSITEALSALREMIWELPLPIFVLGGIYSGIFAISEAAAATAMYVMVVEIFIYKEIKISQLPGIMRESMIMVGSILLILGVAMASTNFMIDAQVPMKLFKFIQAHVKTKFMFLRRLNIFLLTMWALLDIFSAIVIMTPLLLPVAVSYGIHPLHLGIIFLANLESGYCTPPMGINLLIASYRFKKPVTELYRACFPFLIVLFAAVLMITYWSGLSLIFVKH